MTAKVKSGGLTLTFIIFSAWSVMAAKNGRKRVTMNIGLGRTEFTGVNQTDAKAALKVFTQYWIETLIMEEEQESLDRFFSNSRIEHNASKSILPVFFGKAEACVIHRLALDIITELNPQVGRRWRAIAVSEPLVDALICMPKEDGLNPSYRRDITNALLALQKDVYGRQILTLFKAEGMVRFKEEFLVETRALMQRHGQLIQKETTP